MGLLDRWRWGREVAKAISEVGAGDCVDSLLAFFMYGLGFRVGRLRECIELRCCRWFADSGVAGVVVEHR